MESDTPRTDAVKAPTSYELLCKTAELCRQLERENAKLREERDHYKRLADELASQQKP